MRRSWSRERGRTSEGGNGRRDRGDRGRDTRSFRPPEFDDRRQRKKSRSRSGSRKSDAGGEGTGSPRDRSRERERRRRRMQAECIRRAGGVQRLADNEGKEPVRLCWDGFQWVAKTGHSSALQNDPALMNSTRKLRRLYFGNLPLHLGLTETSFQDVIWNEMKTRNFCNNPNDNPVLCVWFAKDKGNYGFIEFASVEETERALHLDGMICLGIPLKVSRPNDYSSATSQQNQTMSLIGQQSAAMLKHGVQKTVDVPAVAPITFGGITSGPFPEITSLAANALNAGAAAASMALPSRIVKLSQVVMPEEIDEEEEYQDVLEDIKNGLTECEEIKNALIVTPKEKEQGAPFSIGDIFIEFGNSEAADVCIQSRFTSASNSPCRNVWT
eukprot:GHVP01053119.1.p2 GENE.GHVP01053119.1~~GHVP01053119.1.p2  ORF type:complete len:385 (-),score=66.29 GHVP01053119.1:1431-2585(-)